MATVKALIRSNKINLQGQAVIYLRYGHQQRTKDLSSGIKILASYWDPEKQSVNSIKGIRKTNQNAELLESKKQSDLMVNTQIENAKAKVIEIARKLQINKVEPEVDLVKRKFLEKDSPLRKTEKDLIALFENYKETVSKSEGTKANYNTAIYHLKKFKKAYPDHNLLLHNVTLELIDEFKKYLYEELEKPDGTVGISDNSVATTLKNLKVLFRYLKSLKYNVPDLSSIKIPVHEKKIHFLTEEEITQLSNHQFKNERLTKVRDIFVFNCFVGLRYSDLQRLNKSHIHNNVIEMVAHKNQNDIFVPLTEVPIKILEAYSYKLPKISEQKFNSYIKEACQEAGIESQVEEIMISAGNKTYHSVPKWEIVTSHTAIKSFITMCVNKGLPPKDVAEMTGKSVEVITKHYYGINKNSLKDRMSRAFS